jgi:AcrR family transcriptional regulator
MEPQEFKKKLKESVIHVIASDGMDRVTTKAIATHAQMNEGYIYRLFQDKDTLLRETFEQLDDELIGGILKYLPVMEISTIEIKERCRALFFMIWKFIIAKPERCHAFIRYYYSPYFLRLSAQKHRHKYQTVVETMTPAFRKGADVWFLLNHVLDFMLSSSIRLFRGEIEDTDEVADNLFHIIYSAIEPQMSWSIRSQYEQDSK